MSAPPEARPQDGYLGLEHLAPTLPASWYFDPAHYQRELRQIWHRSWVYLRRSDAVAAPRSFCTVEFADQSILLVRDEQGALHGFHNTCRHRGARLCTAAEGRMPAAGIVCPYHAWRYDLSGALRQTSSKRLPTGFDLADYPLYRVHTREWHGFIFVCLAEEPPPFAGTFDQPVDRLDTWDLGELVVAHRFTKAVQCNWKVFWENYNECLHCPGVHPKLSQLVPLFGRGLQDPRDDPHWRDHSSEPDPRFRGGLRADARSWSTDGRTVGAPFPRLSAADREAGHVYLTCLPSVFLAAHVDYVRVVRLLPLGPERTELGVEYLVRPETRADPRYDLSPAVEFTNLVMSEDAEVCELNQQGLKSSAHGRGVLMPEEYLLRDFQDWVRAQLGPG